VVLTCAHWIMVGALGFNASLLMSEITAAFPSAGGVYYWSYGLGDPKWGYDILIPIELKTPS
jgi:amino acid transporter